MTMGCSRKGKQNPTLLEWLLLASFSVFSLMAKAVLLRFWELRS